MTCSSSSSPGCQTDWVKVPAALVAGLLGITAACSGTTNKSTSTTTIPADLALARSLNLLGSDLPGWTSSPAQAGNAEQGLTAQIARCAGAGEPAQADSAESASPDFDKGHQEISSNVTVARTSADASTFLDAMRGSRLAPCARQVLSSYARSQLPSGAQVSNLDVTPTAEPSSPESFADRVTAQVTLSGAGSLKLVDDLFGFVAGRVEVELDVTAAGGIPDAALEHRLLSVLLQRAGG